MAAKQRRKSTAKKLYRCTECSFKGTTPQGLGAHKRKTGHMKDTVRAPRNRPTSTGPSNVGQLVTDALKAVDGEMKQMQRKLDRIRKILDE